uniref:DUF2240 family protein n=1 Tax=Geoglobus ahangari TaxID=113653 RepID=A0A7C3YGB7_9EURY
MLKKTIASAFKLKGKSEMEKSELTYTLSFDLKFFSHETSKKVVELAEKRGVIKVEDGVARPNFNLSEIEIEEDFKPDVQKLFNNGLFDKIVRDICGRTGKEFPEVIKIINKKQMELGNILDVEVVALIVAAEEGIDIGNYLKEVEDEVLRKGSS